MRNQSLVPEIKSMSKLVSNISASEPNLFCVKLMLNHAIINLLGFFDLMFSMFK